MFIKPMAEEEGAGRDARGYSAEGEDHSCEYKTASELFDLMAKNQNFQPADDESLTTRDLVLLYKNIDLGTKLMSSANEFKRRTPNQYVETIVYNEDPESDSDISEIYSSEDLHNVVLINKERIDLLNNPPSLENTLCPKFGDIDIQHSNTTTEYERQIMFKDSYIKEQLRSLKLMSSSNDFIGTVLPASLLDYICCKRLEDNYNFYMDNIIRYVQHTIEQLKRISNGDYLTDKAKEKWREVENNAKVDKLHINTKVLETSTSIPLHVERKVSGHATTWDDIVHSEVDIRYLSKILEKKIFFEIPKMICGSYRLFSKCCDDNLIISCKKDQNSSITEEKAEESRVDVVFKLQRSESGHVISNISSIMILQKTEQQETCHADLLPLPYNVIVNPENACQELKISDITPIHSVSGKKIVELDDCHGTEHNISKLDDEKEIETDNDNFPYYTDIDNEISSDQTNDCPMNVVSEHPSECDSSFPPMCVSSESSSKSLRDVFNRKRGSRAEASFSIIPPDELRLTMRRLNIQTSLPEESNEEISVNTNPRQRKSPQRHRIKSPYENKSYILEEKKRKKLLEIRERREKKKIAMSEHCKVSKSKYGKAMMPQSSSSVTKLSITNKSFYNSIYGHMNNDYKEPKNKIYRDKKDVFVKTSSDLSEADESHPPTTSESNSKKYINRSYYLDDTVTEMMYLQMKQKKGEHEFSETTSAVSNDLSDNLKMLTHLISPCSITDLNDKELVAINKLQELNDIAGVDQKGNANTLTSSQSNNIIPVPVNTPKDDISKDKDHPRKLSASNTSVACRKSIEKIYDLMKKLGKTEEIETNLVKSKFTGSDKNTPVAGRKSSTIQGSDSGTSVKHRLTSSDPSYLSFDKTNNPDVSETKIFNNRKHANVVPKVIISAKSQTPKHDGERFKNNRRRASPPKTENPLKAISQLLHDIDNVQKTRHKTGIELRPVKKIEFSADTKPSSRQDSYRKRLEQTVRDSESHFDRYPKGKEKRPKLGYIVGDNARSHVEDKNANRAPKRQVLTDIMDEFKEARGEAVRGPSKLTPRLNSLAQPKKSYVQAHIEDCQARYGKNVVSDRLQKLAAMPQISEKFRPVSAKRKSRRGGRDTAFVSTNKSHPLPQPSERAAKRHLIGNTSDVINMTPLNESSYKQRNVPEKPAILKKMVAVESYVNNHYGRNAADNHLLPEGLTARVPLVPNDIEHGSFTSSPTGDESSMLGTKLHHLVDSIVNSPPNLTIVAECTEGTELNSKEKPLLHNLSLAQNFSNEVISIDYGNNKKPMLKNQIVTLNDNNATDYILQNSTLPTQPYNSETELEKLEHALHRRLSVGTFQKRLRIKNLTITPKQSSHHLLVLQSGDVGSLVAKSKRPQHLKINDSKSETATDLVVSKLSNKILDWNFTNIPMQFATIGYAFPILHSVRACVPKTYMPHYSVQTNEAENASCQTGPVASQSLRENAAQVDIIKELVAIANVFPVNPVVEVENNMLTIGKPLIETHEAMSVPGKGESNEQETISENSSKATKQIVPEIKHVTSNVSDKDQPSELTWFTQADSEQKNTIEPINGIQKRDEETEKACDSKPEVVDYTSSLDILAGLLNEIQKITTCQTQMTNTEADLDHHCTEPRTIQNKGVVVGNIDETITNKTRDIISITSLDKLRHLESNHSILSYYVSNDGDKANDMITMDKEVSVDIQEKEFVNRFTDIPSQFFPVTVNRSTNISNSLIGILSQPSNQSVFSITDGYTYPDSSLIACKRIIELPDDIPKIENYPLTALEEKKNAPNNDDHKVVRKSVYIENKSVPNVDIDNHKTMSRNDIKNSGVDLVMKMKRDVLVTVYSILVFTVFAALSFPEMLYRS